MRFTRPVGGAGMWFLVRFEATQGNGIGGVFGIRMIRSDVK